MTEPHQQPEPADVEPIEHPDADPAGGSAVLTFDAGSGGVAGDGDGEAEPTGTDVRVVNSLHDLAEQIGGLKVALDVITGEHKALADLLAEKRRADDDRLRPSTFAWRRLDARATRCAWIILLDWAGWFIPRFGLHEQVPACWTHPDHGALIEEMSALCLAWHGAYDPDARLETPQRWMEALERTRARVREWDVMRCRTAGEHQPAATIPPVWAKAADSQRAHARANTAGFTWTHRHAPLPDPTVQAGAP